MKYISNDKLKECITGAVYFKEDDGLIPYRFTEEKLLSTRENSIREIRHYGASGIKIDFSSDTETLYFKYTAFTEFSCKLENYNLYFFDVYVDNELILHQGEKNLSTDVNGTISLKLKPGIKRITIYLPGACSVKISDFSIDKQASMNKIEYDKKVLFLGDSITHAAYLDFPSLNYVNIISSRLNYNSVNQAIGGDAFDKKHLLYATDFKSDIIYVAYGTNDWRGVRTNENHRGNAEDYFCELKKLYNKSDINVILPIWRRDKNEHSELMFSFDEVRNNIREVAEKYDVNVIDGMDFIPQNERLYWDGYLHPNEIGFLFYADSLEKWIKYNMDKKNLQE